MDATDRGAGDAEFGGDLGDCELACFVHLLGQPSLSRTELGLLPPAPNGHGGHPDSCRARHNAVEMLMARNDIRGVTGRPRWKRPRPDLIAKDLVDRDFARSGPNQLWATDIEHPTREGTVYCAVVLDVYSRRVVGWSIDASPTAGLVTNALGMAIESRTPPPGTVIHSDRGTQQGGSWAFTDRAKASGLVPSMGSIADCFDNAVIESFWSRMQVEVLDRRRWKTRIELANAIFEYLEIWHNRRRRHSALGWLSPLEFETQDRRGLKIPTTRLRWLRGTSEPPSIPGRFNRRRAGRSARRARHRHHQLRARRSL
ncbi:IS3 family transposase [Pseudonocardia sp. KRD291]|uniref:IS3 family transposase n=1 Tax=Pseudonocardia sp. KRD291 TaxID=2792007 RepID=UPI0027E25CF9|nr:IS3 family transposase [Pseudonocardia sp. KRD291]